MIVALLSLFEHHALSVSDFSAEAAARPDNGVTLALCALLFLLAVSSVLFRRRLGNLVRSLYSQRFYSLLVRESKVLEEMTFPVVLTYDLAAVSLAILLLIMRFKPPFIERFTFWGAFGMVFAMLTLLYFLVFFSNVIYTALFDHPKERYSLNLYEFVFLTNVGVALFPFMVVYHATGGFSAMCAFLPVLLVLFGLYLYRLLKINPTRINLFHFFLYFCTVEILPCLLLVKLISII